MSGEKKREKASPEPGLTVYQAQRGWVVLNLRELWKYRELTFFLAWRDIKVRYKQAVLGAAWVVLQPLIQTVVFTVIFSILFKVASPNPEIPYAVFALTGLVLWTYFSGSLSRATGCLVGQSSLLTKVYFPRLVIPISTMFTGLVDLLISLGIVGVVMAVYGIVPGWQLVFFPVFILLAMMTALSVGLWLGALNVLYRDVGSILPFLVQILMYLSPVVIPPNYVNKYEALRVIFALNPMTGALNGFRWCFLGEPFDTTFFWYSLVAIAVLMAGGLVFFKRMERTFADVI
jgi:lipopolysaccharide transport system permease protein